MNTFDDMIDARNALFNCMGDCETVRMVSREIISRLEYEWFGIHHFLVNLNYHAEIRHIYDTAYEDGKAKIPAIKKIRQDYKDGGCGELGLLEAKEYVEWLCENKTSFNARTVAFFKQIGLNP